MLPNQPTGTALRHLLSKVRNCRAENGVRNASVWRSLLGVENTVIEDVEYDEDAELVVVHVRPRRAGRGRCGACGTRAAWYDHGGGRRRWRGLDVGVMEVFLEADAPRVSCPIHGPTVRQVPWARHGAWHTLGFDQQVAWLATQCSKSAITELMRIAWRTVGAIITRVWADTAGQVDLFAGLRRIGIDEISYKRNYKYLTIVVDHDTGRLVWAAPGRDQATVRAFFDALGPERCKHITHVSADGANWIADVVAERCKNAVRCADPFHVVKWATAALDEVRREVWNAARGDVRAHRARRAAGLRVEAAGHAKALKNARFALWKNPENLTTRQAAKLAWIAKSRATAASRLSAQGGPAVGVPVALRRGRRSPRRMDRVGTPLPDRCLRETAAHHRRAPRHDPRLDRARPV
ncbi:hypothetical protein GCM10028801_25030 [Nocardioides maradonensis]